MLETLRNHLAEMPEQVSVIQEAGNANNPAPDFMVVETTPEGAQHLQNMLQGIGVVEPDSPINPVNQNKA